ncbi:MAG: ATPase central domain protein [Anaerocolumna sp.]|jgi:AAA+ superfamily predicted ATPase|nr:ATPase central domain protein [Anaerocolumna sp.]
MHSSYSTETLHRIGNENYNNLNLLCSLLLSEGYWETPESVIHKSIEEVLDLYIQAVAVSLCNTCNLLGEAETGYILGVTKKDMLGLGTKGQRDEELSDAAQKVIKSPPILLQLCNLYDIEKKDSLAAQFTNSLFNILLALTDLSHARNRDTGSFLMAYYKRISVFYNNGNDIYRMSEREVFRKINSEEFNATSLYLKTINRAAGEEEHQRKKDNFRNAGQLNHGNDPGDFVNRKDITGQATLNGSSLPRAEAETEEEVQADRLSELLTELDDLIGLSNVKQEINSLINLIKMKGIREEYGMPAMNLSYHMVYTGNPGTGKTTIARLIAEIYKELGILSKGNLVETDRSGLVAGYVGQTALKVKEVVEEALGGVLFIDEAYSLAGNELAGDFGKEAVDALVKLMEDNRDNLVVIVAGYTEEMRTFLKSNTGLISRFNRFINFPDYTIEELTAILTLMAKNSGLSIEEEAVAHVRIYLSTLDKLNTKEFGNARGIRNIFEKILVNQANRLISSTKPTKEQVETITLADVTNI